MRWLCCALGLALAVAAFGIAGRWGSAGQPKLSENSRQVAYPAGLGTHVTSSVRVSARLAAAPARCEGETTAVGSSRTAYAALVTQTAVIRRAPSGRSSVVTRLGHLDVNGLPEVVGVIGAHLSSRCAPDWYRVQLAVVPNGTLGWVRAWAVRTYRVRSRIVVDLSERSLRLYRSGNARAADTRRGRRLCNPDTARALLRQRALRASRCTRAVRSRRARHLSAFERARARVGPGWPDRDSRHERTVVDRPRGVTRMHPGREQRHATTVPPRPGRHPDRRHGVAVFVGVADTSFASTM